MTHEPSHMQPPQSLKSDGDDLVIEWADGKTHRLSWSLLRDSCPCATCRTQPDEPPASASLLPVLSLAEAQPLKATGMKPVGNYAYAIEFSDGHNSGIYSLDYLRALGDQSVAQ